MSREDAPTPKDVRDAFERGRSAAFSAAVEECERYSKTANSEEGKAIALNLAVRITQRAKRP